MMNRMSEIQSEIRDVLLKACQKSLLQIENDFSYGVYAFVLYPSAGFEDFGLAISTRDSVSTTAGDGELGFDDELMKALAAHPDLLEQAQNNPVTNEYYEVIANEWEFVSVCNGAFEEINQYLDQNYEQFYDPKLDSKLLFDAFKNAIIDVLNSLKGSFNSNCFEKDLLLGVQFADGSHLAIVKEVSSKVNSKYWHEKLCNNLE